jgi:hypothetical protein
MEQQASYNELLEKINQIQVDISIIKERLPEENEDELLEQVVESLEDVKVGRIKQVA